MEYKELENEIQKLCSTLGVADYGICDITRLEKKLNKGYNQALSIIVPLLRGVLEEVELKPTITYFSHYRTVNRFIDQTTFKIASYIEREGYKTYPIPASQSKPKSYYEGEFPHKTAAVLSGKGWIGKNALFIHPKYGSALRLGTILMNTQFPITSTIKKSQCGQCKICIKACPAQAIQGNNWELGMERKLLYDAKSCSDYMKTHFQHIGRGEVCGICIVKCPYSKINKGNSIETL